MKTPRSRKPVAVALFCGVGGMSLGFEQAGFDVLAGLDADAISVEAYTKNFPGSRAVCADLSKLSGDDIREKSGIGEKPIDVLFGGPPCQGFSLIGKRAEDDPRTELVLDFARLIADLTPAYFVVENVPGMMAGFAVKVVDRFLRAVARSGYSVIQPIRMLDACEFGVPQHRKRVFILGHKSDLPPPTYPEPSVDGASFDATRLRPTVGDAIGDLPDADAFEELLTRDSVRAKLGEPSPYARYLRGKTRDPHDRAARRTHDPNILTASKRTSHGEDAIARFRATEPGTYEPVSRYYRLSLDGVATTLRAGTDRAHGSFMAPRPIHPVYHRCISVREAARLHSFPDWFSFHPTKWHGFRQVGSAVPPLLARSVAQEIARRVGVAPRRKHGSSRREE